MKKRDILIIIMVLCMPAMVWAKGSTPDIDLGLKLGASFAKLDGKSWDGGYKASFLGGALFGLRGNRVGAQIELFYSQTSYSVEGNSFYSLYSGFYNNAKDSAKKGAFRVSYLNMPLLFEVKIVGPLWVQLGPQYSAVMSVKDVEGLVKAPKALFKGGDVSGVAGLEVKLPFHLLVGARYVLGFSNMNNTGVAGAWQNRSIQIHAGFSFL